jgi:hypothetical protein
MLAAGVYELARFYLDDEETSDAVVRIYAAMRRASLEDKAR